MKKLSLLILLFLPVLLLGDVIFDEVYSDIEDPVEIVFAMDTSGSMYGSIVGVRDNVLAFASGLSDSGISCRFGAVTFGDGTNVWDFDTMASGYTMTSSAIEFQARVAGIGASGGGDGPETSLDAMFDGATLYDWSPDTQRVMVMYTDAPFHYRGDGTPWSHVTLDETIDELLEREVILYTITRSYVDSINLIYAAMAETTGGINFLLPYSRRGITTETWAEVFATIKNDITERQQANNLHGLEVNIRGLADVELVSIEIADLEPGLLYGPNMIDLSGPEFIGLDSIQITWVFNDPNNLGITSTSYRVLLNTSARTFEKPGFLEFPVKITDNIQFPAALTLTAYPNPFNSAVAISAPASAVIEIFDLNGRSVAKLPGGEQIWTPEPTEGSGVYLVRAVSPDGTFSDTKRVVYLK
jgi:hypothetical protein